MSGQEEPVSFGEALGETFMFLFFVGIIVGGFYLRYQYAMDMAKDLSEDLTTEQGCIYGTVAQVETWEEGPFEDKSGSMTITLKISDRTRITFKDGRTKELLGIPTTEVPKDKEIAVSFAAYNVLLEIVDAEEHRSREGDGNRHTSGT